MKPESSRNRYVASLLTKIANNRSRTKAVRYKCLECSNWQINEVKACTCNSCPLFPFRAGRNPFAKPRAARTSSLTPHFKGVKGKVLDETTK